MNSPPSTHMLSTCFWMVFGDRSDAARYSRNGTEQSHRIAVSVRMDFLRTTLLQKRSA